MLKCKIVLLLLVLLASTTACAASPATVSGRYSPDQMRADFDRLYMGLQASHYDLFARRPKAEYDALYQRMRDGLDTPLTPLEVRLRFQEFVAFGNVAHSRIDPPGDEWETFRKNGGKAFPLYLRVADGQVYIAENSSGHDNILPGDQVLSVDGEPALAWLGRMRTYVSADNDYMAWAQVETQLPLLVWMAFGEVEKFDVVLSKANGERNEVSLRALSRAGFESAAVKRTPAFELDWGTREARVLEGGVGYLRPGPFYDNRPEAATPWDTAAFRNFIDQSFEKFIAEDVKSVLIDLRDNPGGDNSFSDLMLAWIADKPFRFSPGFDIKISEATIDSNRKRLDSIGGDKDSTSANLAAAYAGKTLGGHVTYAIPLVAPREGAHFAGDVYVLVNRHSYSNTVLVAAIVQDYGFGEILGEETADLASTYGALEKFTLPATGIEVSFPKARILRPSGDTQARGVVPDVRIDTPLSADTEDVVLQKALQIIKGDGGS